MKVIRNAIAKNMTTKNIIRDNFDLSAKFTEYLTKHPDFADELPKNAALIFISGKKSLDEHNLAMGTAIEKKEKRPVYKAVKRKGGWSLKPLAA